MRKIKTEEQIRAKKKRNASIITIFFVSLLVFSTLGYSFYNNPTTVESETREGFFRNGDYWIYQESGRQFIFRNSLGEVNDVQINIQKNILDYTSKEVFLVSENFQDMSLLISNFGYYVNRVQEACYGSCEKDLPEKNCNENLIIYTQKEINKIYQENNCIFIEGDSKAIDAFFYKLLNLN